MNEPSESPERAAPEQALEQLLTRTLRDVPLQRAPATLESRILRELERRAALPWWRRSFAHWPVGARAAFAVLAVVVVKCVFQGGAWAGQVLSSLHDSGALSMPWVRRASTVAGAAGQLAASLTRAVPSEWVVNGVAASVALYVALFGLGIAAYRMLYLNPPPVTGDRP
jgi:hypothetical protein